VKCWINSNYFFKECNCKFSSNINRKRGWMWFS